MGSSESTVEISDIEPKIDPRTNLEIYNDYLKSFALSDNEWIYFGNNKEWQVDENGRMDGLYKSYTIDKSGKWISIVAFYVEGLMEGVEMSFNKDGSFLSTIRYSNGIPIGPYERYNNGVIETIVPNGGYKKNYPFARPNLMQFYGQAMLTDTYKKNNKWITKDFPSIKEKCKYQINDKGQRDGFERQYMLNQKTNKWMIKRTAFYRENRLYGVRMHFVDGHIDHCSHWVDNYEDGRIEYYDKNGNLLDIKVYQKGIIQLKATLQLKISMSLND